ncbi:MAG TPA: hypothetical protein VF747_14195 [Blastocatellia bacterium]
MIRPSDWRSLSGLEPLGADASREAASSYEVIKDGQSFCPM